MWVFECGFKIAKYLKKATICNMHTVNLILHLKVKTRDGVHEQEKISEDEYEVYMIL